MRFRKIPKTTQPVPHAQTQTAPPAQTPRQGITTPYHRLFTADHTFDELIERKQKSQTFPPDNPPNVRG